jgi:hypothetical protein
MDDDVRKPAFPQPTPAEAAAPPRHLDRDQRLRQRAAEQLAVDGVESVAQPQPVVAVIILGDQANRTSSG